MAELQTKTMMTPGGQMMRFQLDPSVDPSEIEAMQQGVKQQWQQQPPPQAASREQGAGSRQATQQQPAAESGDEGPLKLSTILADPDYQALKPEQQMSIRRKFYNKHVAHDPDFLSLDQTARHNVTKKVFFPGPEEKKPSIREPIIGTAKEAGKMATRIAPAIVGGLAAGIPGAVAGGAGGEAAAQYLFGEEFDPTQIAISGALGAVPGAKFAKVTSPLARTALRAGEGVVYGGGTTAASQLLHGETPTPTEVGKGMLMGGAFGTLAGGREGRPKTAPGIEARIPTPEDVAARIATPAGEAPKPTLREASMQKAAAAAEEKAIRLYSTAMNKRAPTAKDLEAARATWPHLTDEMKQAFLQQAAPKAPQRVVTSPKESPAVSAEVVKRGQEFTATQEQKPPVTEMYPGEAEMRAKTFVPAGGEPRQIEPVVAKSEEFQRYSRVLANPELLKDAPRVNTGFQEDQIAVPVGGQRVSGELNFLTSELADQFVEQMQGKKGFPNIRRTNLGGNTVEWGKPQDWESTPRNHRQIGEQFGYKKEVVDEMSPQALEPPVAGRPSPVTGEKLLGEAAEPQTIWYRGVKKPGEEFASQGRWTTDPNEAAGYAGTGGRVVAAHLDIQNPHIGKGDIPTVDDPIRAGVKHDGIIGEPFGDKQWAAPFHRDQIKVLSEQTVQRGGKLSPRPSAVSKPAMTPAIRLGDQIFTGRTHGEIAAQQAEVLKPENAGKIESGFVDQQGKWLTEAEAKGRVAPQGTEMAAGKEEQAKIFEEYSKQRAPRPSRAKPDTELSLQGFLKREGGLPTGELPGEKRALGKQMPGLWKKQAPSLNEQAEKAHAAGFIPEPTTQALFDALERKGGKPAPAVSGFRDVEGEVSRVVEENQRIEMESAAQHMVDRLHGTDEPLQFKGKMYEGAEREGGGNLRLKDKPDKVLTKAKDILNVERPPTADRPEGFPWEAGQPSAVGGPVFEKTEAGMQGVIPGAEGRKVPQSGLKGKGAQATEPTALEAATKPKPPEDTSLFGGIPLPAMKQFVRDMIVEPLSNIRNAARVIYSPRSVTEAAGEGQRLLTRRMSRKENSIKLVENLFRYGNAVMKLAPQDHMEFFQAMETRGKLTNPIYQKIANSLRAVLDVDEGELLKRKLLTSTIDDYMPHQFDKPDVARQVMAAIEERQRGARRLAGPKYFLKQRKLTGTMKEIIESPENQALGENGLKPKFPNPVEAVEKLHSDVQALIHGYDLLHQDLKPKGYIKAVADPRQVPPNWSKVEGYKPPARPVPSSQAPDAPQIYVPVGAYYAPDPLARVLNNYTMRGLLSSSFKAPGFEGELRPGQWIRAANGGMNLANLSASLFHGVTTEQGSAASEFARGVMALKHGEPVNAVKHFGMWGTHIGPVIRDVALGKKMEQAWLDPALMADNPRLSKWVNQYIDSGGRMDNSRDFFVRWIHDGLQALQDKSIVQGGDAHLAKALKLVLTGGTEGIFEHIVGPAKKAAFASRFQDFYSRNPGLSEDGLLKASSHIMDQIDDAFGMVNYDRLGLNRHLRDSLFVGLRAPGWAMGNMKILFGGFEDLAKGQITERSAQMMGQLATAIYTGTLLNLAFTGNLPSVNIKKPVESLYNLFNPEDGGVKPDGTPSRFGFAGIHRDWAALLFNVAKPLAQGDPRAAVQGAGKFMIGKEAPTLGLGTKIFTNKDYFGRDIVDPTKGTAGQMLDYAKSVGKEMLPFSVTNLLEERKQGITRPGWQAGWIGLTPATSPRAIESKFMRLLNEKTQYGGSKSAAQEEHVEYKKELFEKIAKKENISSMLQSGQVTLADVKEGHKRLNLQRQPQGQLKYALSRPGVSLSTLAELAPTATGEEAKLVLDALNGKFLNALQAGRVTKENKKLYDRAKTALRQKIPSAEPGTAPSPVAGPLSAPEAYQ